MKNSFLILVVIQLSFCLVMSQITFSREWVAGKRSSPSSNVITVQEENPACHSIWSAIAYLVEVEKLRELQCGSGPKLNAFLGKMFDSYRKNLDKNSAESVNHHPYDDDLTMKSR